MNRTRLPGAMLRGACLLAILLRAPWALAVTVGPDEMTMARQWFSRHFDPEDSTLPVSFVYGGKPSERFLKSHRLGHVARQLDADRTEHTFVSSDPQTHLVVHCVAVVYRQFPVVE